MAVSQVTPCSQFGNRKRKAHICMDAARWPGSCHANLHDCCKAVVQLANHSYCHPMTHKTFARQPWVPYIACAFIIQNCPERLYKSKGKHQQPWHFYHSLTELTWFCCFWGSTLARSWCYIGSVTAAFAWAFPFPFHLCFVSQLSCNRLETESKAAARCSCVAAVWPSQELTNSRRAC